MVYGSSTGGLATHWASEGSHKAYAELELTCKQYGCYRLWYMQPSRDIPTVQVWRKSRYCEQKDRVVQGAEFGIVNVQHIRESVRIGHHAW